MPSRRRAGTLLAVPAGSWKPDEDPGGEKTMKIKVTKVERIEATLRHMTDYELA